MKHKEHEEDQARLCLRAPQFRHGRAVVPAIDEHRFMQAQVEVVPTPCFLLVIVLTAMNASQRTMAKTMFMDGRDNRPAMTDLLYASKVRRRACYDLGWLAVVRMKAATASCSSLADSWWA